MVISGERKVKQDNDTDEEDYKMKKPMKLFKNRSLWTTKKDTLWIGYGRIEKSLQQRNIDWHETTTIYNTKIKEVSRIIGTLR
ncbi:Highly reducing polyketide synthase bet1 [Dirofilaria immitis]